MSITTLDIIVGVLLAASLLLGWRKGVISQTASILAVIGGIVACRLWGADVGTWFVGLLGEPQPEDGQTADLAVRGVTLLGYAAVFLFVGFWIWMLARMVRSTFKVMLLGWLDSLAGALFMCFKWSIVLSVTLNLYAMAVPSAYDKWGSLCLAVMDFAPWLWGMLLDGIPEIGAIIHPAT